jgi:hypothetical protein
MKINFLVVFVVFLCGCSSDLRQEDSHTMLEMMKYAHELENGTTSSRRDYWGEPFSHHCTWEYTRPLADPSHYVGLFLPPGTSWAFVEDGTITYTYKGERLIKVMPVIYEQKVIHLTVKSSGPDKIPDTHDDMILTVDKSFVRRFYLDNGREMPVHHEPNR